MTTRKDGRTNFVLRTIEAEPGFLERADGSVKYSQGNTQILVSVFGPVEVKHKDELVDRATIDVSVKPRSGLPSTFERFVESSIRNTFQTAIIATLHPRSLISIVVQILNDDGSLLSTCINGVGIALLDCGLPLSSLVCSITCSVGISGGEENKKSNNNSVDDSIILLDPTLNEEQSSKFVNVYGYSSNADGLVMSITQKGMIGDEKLFFRCNEIAKASTKTYFDFVRQSYEKRFNKFFQN